MRPMRGPNLARIDPPHIDLVLTIKSAAANVRRGVVIVPGIAGKELVRTIRTRSADAGNDA